MMAEVGSTNAASSNAQLSSALSSGANALGKQDFLTLMVEQLKNQDPMNPSDATEFTAQLAQFSSLEQLFNVNDNLESMGNTSAEVQRLSALALIGTDVVTASSEFEFSGGAVQFGYDLDGPASEGSLYIRNAAGDTVATYELTETGSGRHFLAWDGTDNNGKALPDGTYTLGVSAFNGDDAVAATSMIRSRVVGVDLVDGADVLVTDSGNFSLAEVESVRGF
ncbi:flagellar hook assembly protein FlgD [Desulfuromonas acetoxidans]|uniref:Basal-body rod modification protein FlgD n=1 Tax=Desulfuromonas acetoxidans (strain DSM 684 / 11070) TaxID=281689 RepID=Q1JZT2_DESA6|nr:flagellar hook assembly protein FlgD [Desulfuromonas acetoxidans]EAT15810.1 flagellar hook capping protein [Desulfuromonas acetoxidans DSM 684]MBF0644988.1 flagellar hook assembly protein FlgD [Desulfuromonas acetoxidans]NVD25644.1 flagellar hook assembly protein FlgD [Desulfuromonas acetoxidans]NVE17697.1 flagellar hook assembly protein FlgD [Desulfuromonas acetoxidans]